MDSIDFFRGKVAIVTGSSSGIGRSSAILLASRGAKVTLIGHPNAKAEGDSIEGAKNDLLNVGANEDDIHTISIDLCEEGAPARIVQETVDKFGRIDILINSAGFVSTDATKKGVDCPIDHFDPMMNIHCKAVILLTQSASMYLEERKGSIVNVSSITAMPFMNQIHLYYSMSKSAQDQLTIQMASHLIQKGIRVNAVQPGIVITNIVANSGFKVNQEARECMLKTKGFVPNGRFAVAEDVAKVIIFLADSSQSGFINGARIPVDGGANLMNVQTMFER
ncbi:hypothetical protein PFISCL1PPCAC_15751 [Pristionchus fissidentatus]|uniref:Dehydrogenase n=1 Tax=Pristionchus fissidentatus TaxID=1538716 RepID=A0AAV5VXV4_9BILA|nr:hypothetical protein PFISCL1PPCAC_15751 [Pristionchus fissidentatus]